MFRPVDGRFRRDNRDLSQQIGYCENAQKPGVPERVE